MFLGFAAFYAAFTFIMPTLAALAARYRAAELVMLLHLLTILSFLSGLYFEQARTSPITVGRVARSTFVVRRAIVEKIRGPFAFGGGSSSCVSTAHLGPSQGYNVLEATSLEDFSRRGSPSTNACAGTCPCESHSPSLWLTSSAGRSNHHRIASRLSSRTSVDSTPRFWEESSLLAICKA